MVVRGYRASTHGGGKEPIRAIATNQPTTTTPPHTKVYTTIDLVEDKLLFIIKRSNN